MHPMASRREAVCTRVFVRNMEQVIPRRECGDRPVDALRVVVVVTAGARER